MATSAAPRRLETSVSLELYKEEQRKKEALASELEYIKTLIGNVSVQEVKRLREEAGKVPILEARLAEKEKDFEKYRRDLDDSFDRRVDREVERKYGNYKANTISKKVKPLERQVEAKDKEIDRLGLVIDTLNEVNASLKENNKETQAKLDRILENQQRNTSEILDLLRAGNIKEAEDKLENMATPVDKKAIVEEVFNLKSQGLNNSEIAKRLQEDGLFDKDLKRGPAKVGDILAGRTYGPVAKELGYIK